MSSEEPKEKEQQKIPMPLIELTKSLTEKFDEFLELLKDLPDLPVDDE